MGMDNLKILGFRHELIIVDKASGQVVEHEINCNRIPQAGIDFLIQAPFGDVPAINQFYCGLFSKNFVANADTSAADIPSVMGEWQSYSESTRPVWDRAYSGASTLINVDSKAIFTPTQDGNVYGAFIVSSPTKGGNTGLLLSVVRFNTVKQVTAGQEVKLVCGLTYIPTNTI